MTRVCIYLSAFLLTSCLFESDEDDNFHVVSPDPDPIQIDLGIAGDTLEVYGDVDLAYDISGFDLSKNYSVIFYIDEADEGHYDFNGRIHYHPKIDSGYLKATIRIITSSGTNSLAGKLGAEQIVFERSVILNVYRLAPTPPKVISIQRSEGSLKVIWEKHDKINFKEYRVWRQKYFDNQLVKTITDRDSMFYFDHNYVGGAISYRIETVTKDLQAARGPVSAEYIDHAPKLLHYENAPESQLKIYWSASRYPANLKRYEIYANGKLIHSTTNAQDTTVTFLPPFGRRDGIIIKSFGAGTSPGYDVETYGDYVVGEIITPFNDIYFASPINRYFTLHVSGSGFASFRVFTLDDNELMVSTISSDWRMIAFSQDFTKLFSVVGNTIRKWDSRTLQSSYTDNIDLSALLAPGQYFFGIGVISDHKFLINKKTGENTGNLIIYNSATRSVEKEYTGVGLHRNFKLYDHDQNYVLAYGSGSSYVFKLNSDGTATAVSTGQVISFDPANDYQSIEGSYTPDADGSIIHRDLQTGTLLGRTHTPMMQALDLDIDTGLIVGATPGVNGVEGMVYDYENQVTLMRCSALLGSKFRLHGDYLYGSDGVRLKVSR